MAAPPVAPKAAIGMAPVAISRSTSTPFPRAASPETLVRPWLHKFAERSMPAHPTRGSWRPSHEMQLLLLSPILFLACNVDHSLGTADQEPDGALVRLGPTHHLWPMRPRLRRRRRRPIHNLRERQAHRNHGPATLRTTNSAPALTVSSWSSPPSQRDSLRARSPSATASLPRLPPIPMSVIPLG